MRNPRFLYALNQIIRVTCVLLIAILVGFEAVPITTGSDVQYINQAGLQCIQSQVFAKSAYVLKYRTDGERAQAINDLQTTLPLFQQEQVVLLTNNASDVQNTLQIIQPDYLALVTAAQSILAHPTAANSIEIEIILSHERSYLSIDGSLLMILRQHANDHTMQLFYIKAFIAALLVALIILSIFVTRRIAELTMFVIEHAEPYKVEA